MTIRAVVFDIGGGLEYTPKLGIDEQWEQELSLKAGELHERLYPVWKGGSYGTMSEAEVHQNIGAIMGWPPEQVSAYMDDVWREYLGTLNVELCDYFARLRPRYITAILSNSFAGAREKEEAAYHFDEMCDLIIYSHEEGVAKPDPRLYALTCERLGVQPAKMIFLDDREVIIAAANEFGIHGILFTDNAQAIAEIEACLAGC